MSGELNLNTSTGALLADKMLHRAVQLEASDIHLDPGDEASVLRFRCHGVLCPDDELQRGILGHYPGVISRLKVMAGLDIAQRRLPQDGRIPWRQDGVSVDIRLSLLPVVAGERAVLRLIYEGDTAVDLNALGMSDRTHELFRAALERSEGLLLVTGPTGSGKSTTLYSAMQLINAPERCVLSVEDPVERIIAGIGQVQVQSDIGLDFSRVLRAFLRQDPEVLVVGEMRDRETVEIAVRASLTGHMVLSTLHAGSCLASISRLRDMGLDGWLVGASLRLVLAQRLVRTLCPACRQPDPAGTRTAQAKGWVGSEEQVSLSPGCDSCMGTGCRGRSGIFECLPVGEELARAVVRELPDSELHRAAGDFETLLDAARRALADGTIGLAEFCRVTG